MVLLQASTGLTITKILIIMLPITFGILIFFFILVLFAMMVWSKKIVNTKNLVLISDSSHTIKKYLVPKNSDIIFETGGYTRKYLFNDKKIRFIPYPEFMPKFFQSPIALLEYAENNPEPLDPYLSDIIITSESLAIVQDESFLKSLVNTIQEAIGVLEKFKWKPWMFWTLLILNSVGTLMAILLAVNVFTSKSSQDIAQIKAALGIVTEDEAK